MFRASDFVSKVVVGVSYISIQEARMLMRSFCFIKQNRRHTHTHTHATAPRTTYGVKLVICYFPPFIVTLLRYIRHVWYDVHCPKRESFPLQLGEIIEIAIKMYVYWSKFNIKAATWKHVSDLSHCHKLNHWYFVKLCLKATNGFHSWDS